MEAGGRLPHRTNSEPSIGSTRLGQRPHQREARYSVVPGVVEAAGAAGHRSVLPRMWFNALSDGILCMINDGNKQPVCELIDGKRTEDGVCGAPTRRSPRSAAQPLTAGQSAGRSGRDPPTTEPYPPAQTPSSDSRFNLLVTVLTTAISPRPVEPVRAESGECWRGLPLQTRVGIRYILNECSISLIDEFAS